MILHHIDDAESTVGHVLGVALLIVAHKLGLLVTCRDLELHLLSLFSDEFLQVAQFLPLDGHPCHCIIAQARGALVVGVLDPRVTPRKQTFLEKLKEIVK
mgnify:CR=1 FL=1